MSPSADDFGAVLARARSGDREATGALLAPHLVELQAYVRLKSGRLLRERISVSDLVQSACREALDDLDAVRCADAAAFRAWLYRVALHKVLGQVDRVTAQRRDLRREVPLDTDEARGLLRGYGAVCSPSQQAVRAWPRSAIWCSSACSPISASIHTTLRSAMPSWPSSGSRHGPRAG